ncbi:hypothetical protein HGRIS_000356 [Hohenbuehelia grisea]|uniref:Uncharacterized protein n=1 Tax=Hohenbuehelia grisea TaxID=104357 RepID=A0ABR3JSE1_9AGAR
MERYDRDMASETPPAEKNEDELAAWLRDTHIEPDEHGDTMHLVRKSERGAQKMWAMRKYEVLRFQLSAISLEGA